MNRLTETGRSDARTARHPDRDRQPTELKEVIMNTKNLLAAAALTLIGSVAFAAEGEQWMPQQGALTRSEVKAELARSQTAREVNPSASSYGRFPTMTYAVRKPAVEVNRDAVRAEARASVRSNRFDSLYVGG
jgi:hypothetical protein